MPIRNSSGGQIYWQDFSISEDDKTYTGKFCLDDGHLKVSSYLGTKTARILASNSSTVVDQSGLAKMLLRELIRESKKHD